MSAPPGGGSDVRRALAAVLVARTAVNGGSRGPFPFLPAIARGLGVSLETMGVFMALKAVAGFGAPLVLRPSERLGRRTVMLAGLGLLLAGCLIFAVRPPVLLAGVAFLLIGLAKVTFDVPMQGWFSDRVPPERRGWVFGISELTWGLALLLVVPVSGLLIPRIGWQAPFLVTALLGVAGVAAVLGLIRPDRPERAEQRPLRLTAEHAKVLASGTAFWIAAEALFVVYGAWLEDELGMSVPAIGAFTLLVVAAELLGEGVVTTLSDRLGLRRSALLGLLLTGGAFVALALVGDSLALAMLVVFVWFAGFELALVSMLPLLSVLGGNASERLLGWFAFAMTAGRAVGAVLGPRIYGAGGIGRTGAVAAAVTGVAAVLLLASRPPRQQSTVDPGKVRP